MCYLLISAIIPKLFLVIQAPLVYGEIIRRCFANISLVAFCRRHRKAGVLPYRLLGCVIIKLLAIILKG